MKIWNVVSGVASTLFVASILTFSLSTEIASAHGQECKGPHKGDPGCGDNLQFTFDLTIEITHRQFILSDNGSYPDSTKDHVGVFTGSGPGFRFDTNLQNTNKLSRWLKARHVYMTVDPTAPDRPYEIDFRFNQTTGLALDSLVAGGASGTVAASLKYYGGSQVVELNPLNHGILGFGSLNAPTHPDAAACLAAAGEIKVTRNSATQWTLESPASGKGKACRFAVDANGDIECTRGTAPCNGVGGNPDPPELIDFKFEFTIEEQE